VIVAVVPAAGHATRLRGLVDGSKELLDVDGQPVIDRLLELLAPAEEVRVVVRPAKQDLVAHLRGRVTLVEGEPANVSQSIALGAAGLADDDVVLVGFPDTIFGPADAFERLVAALREPYEAVVGAFTFAEPWRSDVLELDGDRVCAVYVRPREPGSNLVWGCFAARRAALDGLELEEEPGRLLDRLAAAGRLGAIRLGGELVDLGTPESLATVR
jgi:dTDP-glucose pyrophosphorylase